MCILMPYMVNFDVQRSPTVKSEAAPFLKIILMSRNHIPSFMLLLQNAQFHKFLVQIRSNNKTTQMFILRFTIGSTLVSHFNIVSLVTHFTHWLGIGLLHWNSPFETHIGYTYIGSHWIGTLIFGKLIVLKRRPYHIG